MDSQRPLIYLSLVFISFLIWQAWVTDHAPTPQAPAQVASNATNAAGSGSSDLPSAASLSPGSSVGAIDDAANNAAVGGKIKVTTDVYHLEIDTAGGNVTMLNLPTYPVSLEQKDEPFKLFDSRRPYLAQSGLLHDKVSGTDFQKRAPNHYAEYKSEQQEYTLTEGTDVLEVPLYWKSEDGVVIEKVYRFTRGEFTIGLEYRINNQSPTEWIARQYNQLRHGPLSDDKGGFLMAPQSYTGAAYYTGKFNKAKFDDMAEERVDVTAAGGWVSMLEHYFMSAWIPESTGADNRFYTKVVDGYNQPEYLIGMQSSSIAIAAGETGKVSAMLYAGPKLQESLEELAPGLELNVDYGIFTIFSKPLFWLLSHIHALIGNWGWSIILLTILIKAAFYKLSEAGYRSMAKMRAVAPKLQSLKAKFGEDKQRQQQAMMELYKKEKINPLGGCLPMLIQIPVFIALYWVLIETVELRQAPWMFWIYDLSIKDPFFILPLLMGATMFAQYKLNPPQPDPIMQKMMMGMPIMFTFFFAFFASGLVLYWFTNNLLSIAQQWYITRKLELESKKI